MFLLHKYLNLITVHKMFLFLFTFSVFMFEPFCKGVVYQRIDFKEGTQTTTEACFCIFFQAWPRSLHLLIVLFYSYIVATYSFMLMFTALSIQQQRGGEKEKKGNQPAILLHHNHYGPFHMGERNFIIVPAGTVKTKLMNTESFLPWRVVALQCCFWGMFKGTFFT